MMRTTTQVLGGLLLGSAGLLLGQGNYKADLSGYDEVPAMSTSGSGDITVQISADQKSLDVTLAFTNLEGVASAAHLYFGMPATTGGVVANLCGSPKPACPTTANGTVTGGIL